MSPLTPGCLALAEKTIHDEEVSNVDIAESTAELEVGLIGLWAKFQTG